MRDSPLTQLDRLMRRGEYINRSTNVAPTNDDWLNHPLGGEMSVFLIETYVVTIAGQGNSGDRRTYRVPRTELNSFVSVLNFNQAEYEVKKEPNPLNDQAAGGSAGVRGLLT